MTNNNQQQKQQNEVAVLQKDITDSVNQNIERLQSEGLSLPRNYSYSNALKSAFFAMTNSASGNLLELCTRESVANALLDMVIQGLSPAKTQCYFINYGGKCQLNRSYFGTQAVLKRLSDVKDIWANVIFEGDEFEYEIDRGIDKLVSHKTQFLNRDNEIIGAYAVVQKTDGEEILTPMTRKEIEASWSQSKTKQAVHKKFPQEMAKRTVINRAAKAFINTSDDSDTLIESINNTTENEYDENQPREINPQHEVDENANTEVLDFEPQETEQIIDAPNNEPEPIKQDIQTEPEPAQASMDGPGF